MVPGACAPLGGPCAAHAPALGPPPLPAPGRVGGNTRPPRGAPGAGRRRSHVPRARGTLLWVFLCRRIDPYGFERPEDFDYAAYEEFFSTYLAILTRRAIKWSKLLKGGAGVQKSVTREFGA